MAKKKSPLGSASNYGSKIIERYKGKRLDATTWLEKGMWAEVSSSNVHMIRYDKGINTLEVEFINGGIYHYKAIPELVARRVFNATSVGSALDHFVKKAGYLFVKI